MRNLLAAIALVLSAHTAITQQSISPQEFEAIVTGQTFSYASEGRPFGAEEYLNNRRVRWSFLDGECLEGHWYSDGPQICFVYEDIPDPQCWQFFLDGGQLLARFENDPTVQNVYETSRMNEPLYCKGPKVGA